MHLSRYPLDVLLGVSSHKWVIACSLNVCVVCIKSDLERTKESAHTPQFVVGHSVLPLSSVLIGYPDLPSTNYALSSVHTQQILRILMSPFKA